MPIKQSRSNNFRIHSTLGYMSPVEFRKAGLVLPRSSKKMQPIQQAGGTEKSKSRSVPFIGKQDCVTSTDKMGVAIRV